MAAALGALAMLVVLALPGAAAAHEAGIAGHPSALEIGPGDSVFWNGETVDDANVADASMCGVQGPCFDYSLTLAGRGKRLRVAIDTPSREDSFEVDLIDPSGAVAGSLKNSNQFNEEAFIEDPEPGEWAVKVIPKGATNAPFRLRAKLESTIPKSPKGKVALLPNLRTDPPMELGFIAPLNPMNGLYPPDTVNPPADAAGAHPASCTADEMAPVEAGGYGAKRCLRLTSGPMNIGRGPYDMRFTFVDDIAAGEGELAPDHGTIQHGPMFQAVHYSDGSMKLRPAGTYSFHVTHFHFHDNNVLTYELFKVLDPGSGQIKRISGGTKSGFCPADQLFGQWDRFEQQPSGFFGEGDEPTGNCFSPTDGFLGLTVGWGDVYRWQRPGQFVEFAGQGNGLYVLRSTVDKEDEVLESNDDDNSSYALARVTGDHIDLLERGWGRSPWDPHKTVFRGAGPASRR